MTAQEFVDQLNIGSMAKMGYELLEGPSGRYWAWPIYNHHDGHKDDLKAKDMIAAQRARTGKRHYETEIVPADEQTRRVTGWRMWNIPE